MGLDVLFLAAFAVVVLSYGFKWVAAWCLLLALGCAVHDLVVVNKELSQYNKRCKEVKDNGTNTKTTSDS